MLRDYAVQMSDLTVELFTLCQEREASFVARYNLRVAEFRCLYKLLQHGPMPVKELAELLNNTPSRLTRVIDSLIDKGLVLREEPKEDRRKKIISLSEKGAQLAREMKDQYDAMHTEILKEIQDDSHQTILESLRKLIKAMNDWSAKQEQRNDEELNYC